MLIIAIVSSFRGTNMSLETKQTSSPVVDWFQFTFINDLSDLDYEDSLTLWRDNLHDYIKSFLTSLHLIDLIEEAKSELTKYDNYFEAKGTTFGYNHIWKLTSGIELQYHSEHPRMGLMFQISGVGCKKVLNHYRKNVYKDDKLMFNKFMLNLNKCFNEIKSRDKEHDFKLNITRCDVAIDYFNYDFVIDDLARQILDKKIVVFYQKYMPPTKTKESYYKEYPSRSACDPFSNNGIFGTIYVGRNSDYFTYRLYDKLLERKSKKGKLKEDIKNLKSWNRCELELKSDLATSFYENTLVSDDDNFVKLIYTFITRKVIFKHNDDKLTNYFLSVEQLKNCENVKYERTVILKDITLELKKEYFLNDSGIVSLVQMIREIEGDEEAKRFLYKIYTESKIRKMNKDTIRQIREILEFLETQTEE